MTPLLLISNANASEPIGETFWMPRQASSFAAEIDQTYYFIYWVCIIFFVALMGGMIYLAVKYKQRTANDVTPVIKGSHRIEFAWSVFPTFLLIIMFVLGFKAYIRTTIPPADALQVQLSGQQWKWTYYYPSYGVELGTEDPLVVPQQTGVRLRMASEDVLHSYYVPDFRMKKDVVPNRYTTQWFEANGIYEPQTDDQQAYMQISGKERDDGSKLVTYDPNVLKIEVAKSSAKQCKALKEADSSADCKPLSVDEIPVGIHQVFCTEYCGNDHSRMLSAVAVLKPEHFDIWIKGRQDFSPWESADYKTADGAVDQVKIGKYYAGKLGCTGCHSVTGEALTGPTWKGLSGKTRDFENAPSLVADSAYIKESILEPQKKIVKTYKKGAMNSGWELKFKGKNARNLDAIILYIESLKE